MKSGVILISGRGSNMRSIVEAPTGLAVKGVISNRPAAQGLEWARARGIPAVALDHKAHATRALTDLIDRGLATRVVDAQDRRLREVRLTPAGRSIADATGPFIRERQERLEACVSAADFRVFDKVLALMTTEAERMLAEEMNKNQERHSARG